MRYTKTVLAFGTFALGLAMAASTYHLTISDPTWVGGNELKPGDYKIQVEGDKATIKGAKTSIEVPAKVATGQEKYPATAFRSENVNGKQQLEEIRIGGSKTSILFSGQSSGAGGE